MNTETVSKPRFEHDCSCCHFLGSHGSADLWVHPGELYNESVIARFSSEGSDYKSGTPFIVNDPNLAQAARLAIECGLLNPENKTGSADGLTIGESLAVFDSSDFWVMRKDTNECVYAVPTEREANKLCKDFDNFTWTYRPGYRENS